MQLISNNPIAVKKIAFFSFREENDPFSSLKGKMAIFFIAIWIITNELLWNKGFLFVNKTLTQIEQKWQKSRKKYCIIL